ncbi:MAG: tetratricopeptide repeat protein [Syntrophales bacterium]|nr:tetratricopeptide repeat protein [Syntrophales bacterium]
MLLTHQKKIILICMLIVLSTVLAYWNITNASFIQLDDYEYVVDNPYIHGLNHRNISWAFTATHAYNWHPLTWISLMMDYQIYGLRPGGFHFTNLLFHIMNALMIFLIFNIMTGSMWKSAFTAGLFALHPLHVESVAWISERKDVLSTFFFMTTMYLYIRYVKNGRTMGIYLSVILSYALGLMAKPMLVTLPAIMLLLDYWPLQRFQGAGISDSSGISTMPDKKQTKNRKGPHPVRKKNQLRNMLEAKGFDKQGWSPLVVEKIPLFILSAFSCIITFYAQQKGGSIMSLQRFGIADRLGNAFISYADYIGKMIWPWKLAIFYPFPTSIPLWKLMVAVALLCCITAAAVHACKRFPYLLVGWLWFLGTLVPVIGLVQVGVQAMADRYTYIPLVGLFIMLSWGIPDLLQRWRYKHIFLGAAASTILVALTFVSCSQVQKWNNDFSIFGHALQVTANNAVAHACLGDAQKDLEHYEQAGIHYREALRIDPSQVIVHNNLGIILKNQGHMEEAINHFREAIRQDPNSAAAHNNLGNALLNLGRKDEAIFNYQEALRIQPNFGMARKNLQNAVSRP